MMNKKTNNEKRVLLKIKRRICIGVIAIFVVSYYELVNSPKINLIEAVMYALYMSLAIGILGYLVVKLLVRKYMKNNESTIEDNKQV